MRYNNIMRCFYFKNLREGELSESDFSKEESRHLFKVLRAKTGDKILLIDGKGKIAEAEIANNRNLIVNRITSPPPPKIKLHLYFAPPRKNKLDQLLKQCSEIGIWKITPIITERGVYQPSKESALERMGFHLLEGCKQAKNPFLPELCKPVSLEDAVKVAASLDQAFFGSTKGESSDIVKSAKEQDIAWFIGPEGGFTDDESELIESNGIKPLSIGQWVMRIETAAIVGSSLLMSSNNPN